MDTKENNINIDDLLVRPIWQLTCEEYVALMRHVLSEHGSTSDFSLPRQAIGMSALAKALGCSASLLYGIRHHVDFSDAVISRIGRKEVYDIEAVRALANEYTKREREARQRRANEAGA